MFRKKYSRKVVFSVTLVFVLLAIVFVNLNRDQRVNFDNLAQASSWYDYDWNYRKKITIQHEQVDADLTDFPVLISLDSDTELVSSAQDDGDDILFTDNAGNKLPHEIELFDSSTGQLVAWVKTDLLNESDTNLYIYFGNTECDDQQSATDVWSSGYVSVFHLNEQNDGNANSDDFFLDSSATGNHADDRVALTEKEGKIGLGQTLNGIQDHIIVDEHMIGGANQAFVVSAWVKSDQKIVFPDGRAIIHNYYNAVQNGNWELSSNNSDTGIRVSARNSDRSATYTGTRTHPSFDGQWHNHKFVVDPTLNKVRRYTDGVLKTNENFNALGLPIRDANSRARVMHALGGSVDELYFYDGILSGEWITTEYNNQSSPDTFIELSTLEIGDVTPPENPTTFSAYDSSSQLTELSEGWNKYSQPYFSWNDAEEPDSAVDGYYIYFGTDETADPELTSGIINADNAVQYQAETNLNISPTISDRMTAGETYYFILKSKNVANNEFSVSEAVQYFTYSYDPTAPNPPEYINVSPVGCSVNTAFTFTWPAATDTGGSNLAGYQYRRGSTGTVTDIDALTLSTTSYQEGDNIFYIRSVDNAGNTSSWQTSVYCSTATVQVVDGPTVDAGPSSITVSWVSSKSTTGYVKVYEGNTYISEQGLTNFSLSHAVKVIGLEPEKAYRYQITWTDQSGNLGESDWYETSTATAPQINNLDIDILSPTALNISWSSTIFAKYSLEYGIGSYGTVVASGDYLTGYSGKIAGLTSGSTYQFRVNATGEDGTKFFAGESVTMPPLPSIGSLKFEPIKDRPDTAIKISWTTNVELTSSVYFGPKGEQKKEISKSDRTKDHEVVVGDLLDNSEYEIYASGIDQYGNVARSSVQSLRTEYDSRPPKIENISTESSNVASGKTDTAQITIGYTTDEPARCFVDYGIGISGENYSGKTVVDEILQTNHISVLSNLAPQSPYHFKISCSDKAGNQSESADQTVISGEITPSVFNIILKTLNSLFGWLGKVVN